MINNISKNSHENGSRQIIFLSNLSSIRSLSLSQELPNFVENKPSMLPFTKKLFQPIDIASLVFFRLAFGIIMLFDIVGDLWHGWVRKALIQPEFHFTYYGFDWVQPLPGWGMYAVYALLIVANVGIILGWRYRLCAAYFAVGVTYSFLIEKSYYLNHGYLVCLLSWLLLMLPLNRAFSIDALRKPSMATQTAEWWQLFIVKFHIGIVYFFGGIAKLNSDWLQASPIQMWIKHKTDLPIVGPLMDDVWMAYFISYGGLLLDLTVVFFLIWRRTRWLAFAAVLFFHGFNKMLFGIGIFPAMSIVMTLLFFPPDLPRKWGKWILHFLEKHKFTINLPSFFKKNSSTISPTPPSAPTLKRVVSPSVITILLTIYCTVHLLLPLRHHLYEGNASWTEEGHRFAWRMMLRAKSATLVYKVIDPETCEEWLEHPSKHLIKRQEQKVKTHPGMIVQYAHYLAQLYAEKGYPNVEIYARSRAGLNGRKKQDLINKEVNLLTVDYLPYQKANWIVPLDRE